jgi:hypothetical protein
MSNIAIAGVRWCQMLCLSDACSVVSDGVGWFSCCQVVKMVSGGEYGVKGKGGGG